MSRLALVLGGNGGKWGGKKELMEGKKQGRRKESREDVHEKMENTIR